MIQATSFLWDLVHPLRGDGYQFWSGIAGSFLTSLPGWTVAGVLFYRHHNCDAPKCWRRGPHKTADGLHKLCRKHHPDLPSHRLSLREINLRHHKAKEQP